MLTTADQGKKLIELMTNLAEGGKALRSPVHIY